jgi:hypothetical protein
MKTILNFLLQVIMNYIVGKDVFGKIQTLVEEVGNNNELSGAEKREKVLAEAKAMGGDFASHLLNLAVEAAVALVKEKTITK